MFKKFYLFGHQKAISLWSQSLYRNSFWLMAGSFAMAGIGFFYWMLAARLYTPEQIGLATTFLSAASLVNGLAIFGFGTTIIRYLPKAVDKSKVISTTFTVVVVSSIVVGAIYVIGLPFWTPRLMFVRSSLLLAILTVLFFPVNTLNGITDSVFTALKSAHWVFVSNLTQSTTKLLVLVFLAAFGTWGVIGSNVVAVILATSLCLIIISKKFHIIFRPTFDLTIIQQVKKFALGNHLSGLIGGLPGMILPIIITNRISPAQTAYFFIPNMIASLLIVIPSTISRSYLAESSHSELPLSLKKPLGITYSILAPALLFLIIFGRYILHFFGAEYAIYGYPYLALTCVSIFIAAINYFLGARLLLKQKMHILIYVQIVNTIVFVATAYLLVVTGITGVGYASIAAQICSFLILLFEYRRK